MVRTSHVNGPSDPNPNPAPGITIYPVGEDGGPDASSPTYVQPDGTVVVPDLVPKTKRHAHPGAQFNRLTDSLMKVHMNFHQNTKIA